MKDVYNRYVKGNTREVVIAYKRAVLRNVFLQFERIIENMATKKEVTKEQAKSMEESHVHAVESEERRNEEVAEYIEEIWNQLKRYVYPESEIRFNIDPNDVPNFISTYLDMFFSSQGN